MIPRSGGSSLGSFSPCCSLASETASSSTIGRGGGVFGGPRLRLRCLAGSGCARRNDVCELEGRSSALCIGVSYVQQMILKRCLLCRAPPSRSLEIASGEQLIDISQGIHVVVCSGRALNPETPLPSSKKGMVQYDEQTCKYRFKCLVGNR